MEDVELSSDNADIVLDPDNQVSLYLDERSLAARSCGDEAIIIQSDALEVGTRWHSSGSDPNVGKDCSTHVDCHVNIA